MPRAKTGRSSKGKVTVVDLQKDQVDKQGYFDFIVNTFRGYLPGTPGYDPKKDRMLTGFQYGNTSIPYGSGQDGIKAISELTPYDFLTNPTTGLRKWQKVEPHGSGSTHLVNGIGDFADLPPLFIWSNGAWLADLIWEPTFDLKELSSWLVKKVESAIEGWPTEKDKTPAEIYPFWVTSGEGTTGNNLYRIFELPESVCSRMTPHHPVMWPEDVRKHKWSPLVSKTSYKKDDTPKPPPIPAGVRYRCTGCGHWFAQADLPGHAQVCGKGEEADWAMMCHDNCGCRTLDEASKPKPGFPRKKKEVVKADTSEGTPEPVHSAADDAS